MKKVLTILSVFIFTLTFAQSKYDKGMQKAFELWGSNKPFEAVNMFERIATAEQDNWLPYYYIAQINVIKSFGERDKEKLSLQLDKAKENLAIAESISPNNAELMIIEALMHTAWIVYDGQTYGMTLGPKIGQLYGKAMAIAPNNPRVVFSKAENDMGTAKFFGQDPSVYCKDVAKSLELFTTFKAESDYHPQWGKDRAEQTYKNCTKGE